MHSQYLKAGTPECVREPAPDLSGANDEDALAQSLV
jgi:hypothetical protein